MRTSWDRDALPGIIPLRICGKCTVNGSVAITINERRITPMSCQLSNFWCCKYRQDYPGGEFHGQYYVNKSIDVLIETGAQRDTSMCIKPQQAKGMGLTHCRAWVCSHTRSNPWLRRTSDSHLEAGLLFLGQCVSCFLGLLFTPTSQIKIRN